MISRRSLFGGVAGILAAPAIVKASSLMTVKALPQITWTPMSAVYGGELYRLDLPDAVLNHPTAAEVFIRIEQSNRVLAKLTHRRGDEAEDTGRAEIA